MIFNFTHKETGEKRSIEMSTKTIQLLLEDHLLELVCRCDCQPVGETNVVECDCIDYLEGFKLDKQAEESNEQ